MMVDHSNNHSGVTEETKTENHLKPEEGEGTDLADFCPKRWIRLLK